MSLADIHPILDVIHNLDVGIIIMDSERRIELWNGFMANHSRIEAEQALGVSIYQLFPELDPKWFEQKVKQCTIIQNQAFVTWEQRSYVLRLHNDRPITGQSDFMYQNVTFLPLINHKGEVDRIGLIIYDATALASARLSLANQAHP